MWKPVSIRTKDSRGAVKYEQPSEKTRPDFLTKDEIEYIVYNFPPVKSADPRVSELARDFLIWRLKRYLMGVELVKNVPGSIERFSSDINNAYEAARIGRGEAVGILASEAIGSTMTQIAFDSFHIVDGMSVGSGISAIQSLLYANKPNSQSVIHFNQRMNYRDVIDTIPMIVESNVSDFLAEDPKIIVWNENYKGDEVTYDESGNRISARQWWHDVYEKSVGKRLPNSLFIMRLKLDHMKMYKHCVTLKDIAESIEENGVKAKKKPLVLCAFSPIAIGIVDIFPIEDNLSDSWGASATPGKMDLSLEKHPGFMKIAANSNYKVLYLSRSFLSTAVKENLSKSRVSGIEGIRMLQPFTIKTTTIGTRCLRLKKGEIRYYDIKIKDEPEYENRLWKVYISKDVQMKGPKLGDFRKLAKMSGLKEILLDKDPIGDLSSIYYLVPMWKNDDEKKIYIEGPLAVMRKFVEKNEKENEEIQLLANYTFAVTQGTNLAELYKIPWIDKSKTFSNNMFEIKNLFGIESSRNYAVSALHGVMRSAGVTINSRHITLIADYMFNRGEPLGLNYSGLVKQDNTTFSEATVERAMSRFNARASRGRSECVNNVAGSIALGIPVCIGDEVGRVRPLPEDREKALKMYRAEKELIKMQKMSQSERAEYMSLVAEKQDSKKIGVVAKMAKSEAPFIPTGKMIDYEPTRKSTKETVIVDPNSKKAKKLPKDETVDASATVGNIGTYLQRTLVSEISTITPGADIVTRGGVIDISKISGDDLEPKIYPIIPNVFDGLPDFIAKVISDNMKTVKLNEKKEIERRQKINSEETTVEVDVEIVEAKPSKSSTGTTRRNILGRGRGRGRAGIKPIVGAAGK